MGQPVGLLPVGMSSKPMHHDNSSGVGSVDIVCFARQVAISGSHLK